MKQFIGIYPDAVDLKLCEKLISVLDNTNYATLVNDNSQRTDIQVVLESVYPTTASELLGVVNSCLMEHYIPKIIPFLADRTFLSSITLLQKTEPYGGFHNFHCEDTSWNCHLRTMAWMVYLNDVEEGGETEFIYQQTRIKPEQGMVLICPGGYTHMHRGNPPMSTKYIATGWYQADSGTLNEHLIKKRSPNS